MVRAVFQPQAAAIFAACAAAPPSIGRCWTACSASVSQPAVWRSALRSSTPVLSVEVEAAEAEPVVSSSCNFDFVPLITALKVGDFLLADQVTRDGLIKIAGEAAVKRGYVYFAEVPRLPEEDIATIERLWLTYSKGKFGYSVQREFFRSKKIDGNFDKLFDRIGWRNKDGTLLRWLPDKGNEFIYDLEKAPAGHLPLTSTLRGQQLLLGLLNHPALDRDEFKK